MSASRVTVIIPVYNCEKYIQRCLDSLFGQTFQDFNIIAVNDGSQDSSLKILRQNAETHGNLKVIDQANHGQGFSRNLAIKQAKGEYILFVDADDYIEPETLQMTVDKADETKSDVVHFDWKMAFGNPAKPQRIEHQKLEPFAGVRELKGGECDQLLLLPTYYSVNNLFRTAFLKERGILYDEGHIYEDVLFIVRVASWADKIVFLPDPLYVVQMNQSSTTQSGVRARKHYADFIRAVQQSFKNLRPRTDHTTYYLAAYFLEKLIIYYQNRVPAEYKRRYLKEFVDSLSQVDIAIPKSGKPRKFLNRCLERDVFRRRKYGLFRAFVLYKAHLLPLRDRLKR